MGALCSTYSLQDFLLLYTHFLFLTKDYSHRRITQVSLLAYRLFCFCTLSWFFFQKQENSTYLSLLAYRLSAFVHSVSVFDRNRRITEVRLLPCVSTELVYI